ncbi:hypothetical protein D9M68_967810 [compost metagenome]
MGPDLVHQIVGGARVDQHRHHGELALVVFVDQVRDHGKTLVVHLFLRRVVEVELQQLVGGAAHGQRVAGVQVDLDGVAVVDHAAAAGLVIEEQRFGGALQGAGFVDVHR